MPAPAKRAIVVGLDGASMELVLRLAAAGHTPAIQSLVERGVHRPMLGVYPTLTPPGWTALTTGSWPGTHEVMDFNIRARGRPLTETLWGINTRLSRSEYLWNTAERAGRRPILVKWEMSWPPTVRDDGQSVQVEGTGPGVANHHQIAGYHLFVAGRWAPRPLGGARDPETVDPSALQANAPIDPVVLRPAAGWAGLPPSAVPPLEAELVVRPLVRGNPSMLRGRTGVARSFFALVYASGGAGYDRVRVAASRDAAAPLADLAVGEWSDWRLESFVVDGESLRGYLRLKLIALSPDADRLEVFVPQVWPAAGDYAVPAGLAAELAEQVGPFLQNPARDAIGLVDDDTYFELLDWFHVRLADVARYLARTREWDLLFVETHAPDYANHTFLSLADPIGGASPAVQARCRRGLERTYASVDLLVRGLLELADGDTVVVLCSDHGGTPSQHRQVSVEEVLEAAGLLVYAVEPATGRRRVDLGRSRAVSIGLCHVFVNLQGREPDGVVAPAEYEATQRQIVDALHAYVDPATGRRPFVLALRRSDAEMLNLQGELVGDVVYALDPAFDGAHGKQLPSARLGIGAQHSLFVLAGAGVRRGLALRRQVRVVDVAPTVAYLLGLPMPADVEGGVVYEALVDPNWPLTELARLAGR